MWDSSEFQLPVPCLFMAASPSGSRGGTKIWAIENSNNRTIWTRDKETTSPDANWTPWTEF